VKRWMKDEGRRGQLKPEAWTATAEKSRKCNSVRNKQQQQQEQQQRNSNKTGQLAARCDLLALGVSLGWTITTHTPEA